MMRINAQLGWLKNINVLGDASKMPARFLDGLEIIAQEEARTNGEIRRMQYERIKRRSK